jgi:predicted lipoprotein
MFAPKKELVRLEGTIEAATETYEVLLRVHDLLPEGLERIVVLGLAVQLGYAIEDAKKN